MSNIQFAFFNHQVHCATKNGIKPFHTLSHERHQMEVKGANLIVTIDDLTTIVPLINVSSIIVGNTNEH